MPTPVIHEFPVKRPGFITAASWLGGPQDMVLRLEYIGAGGQGGMVSLATKGENPGEICLPTSSDLATLGGATRARDILIAHARMACMIAGHAIPGSIEFDEAIASGQLANLQTALGTVKVVAARAIDDVNCQLDFRKGTGPIFTVDTSYAEVNRYSFDPSTQLLVVAGAVEKEFPTYVHDYPNVQLTEAQKDAIAAYVLTLEPWI